MITSTQNFIKISIVVATLLITLGHLTSGHEVKIVNNCENTVWVGIRNLSGQELPSNGGFLLNRRSKKTIKISTTNWNGQFWGRTKCLSYGECETGDCGYGITECGGKMGKYPITTAQLAFQHPDPDSSKSSDLFDFYNVSLVHGFNLPLSISTSEKSCERAGCNEGGAGDLNSLCPDDLQYRDKEGRTIACLSPCQMHSQDENCCSQSQDSERGYSCPILTSKETQKKYKDIANKYCPSASSSTSSLTSYKCKVKETSGSKFQLTFCP